MEHEYIGKHIKKLRNARGYSQKDLAHLINRSVSSVAKYESNQVELPITVLDDIAKVLEVPIEAFFSDENILNKEQTKETDEQKAYKILLSRVELSLYEFSEQNNYYDETSQVAFQFYLQSIIDELAGLIKYCRETMSKAEQLSASMVNLDTESISRNIERLVQSIETTAIRGTYYEYEEESDT